MKNKRERELRRFEAVQIALAKEDAKHMPTTPEIEREVDALYAAGRRRMAEIRYAENAQWPVQVLSDEIRPEILAMSGAEVIAAKRTMSAGPSGRRPASHTTRFASVRVPNAADHPI